MNYPPLRLIPLAATSLLMLHVPISAAYTHDFNPPGPKQIIPAPNTTVSVGKPVKFKCTFGYVGSMKIEHNSQGVDAYLHSTSWQLPVEMRVDGKAIHTWKYPGVGNPTSTWTEEKTWTPKASDAGKKIWLECIVDPQAKVKSSSMKTYVNVTGQAAAPLTRSLTLADTHKAGTLQMAKPDLVVEIASASPDNNCQNNQGARVKVRVKNIGGGSFPASPGNYVLFVDAGAGLVDGGVELPALFSNQSVEKELVLNTLGAPSQLAGKTVSLEIQLNKLKWVAETNHLNNTRKLVMSFPANYCKTATRIAPGQLKLPRQSR